MRVMTCVLLCAGSNAGVLFDRRRPGQAHLDQGGLSTISSKGQGKGMWQHSSSWQDLGHDQHDQEHHHDNDVGQGADRVYGGRDAGSDSESTALLYRPHHHVTLTVSRQGEKGPYTPSSQLVRCLSVARVVADINSSCRAFQSCEHPTKGQLCSLGFVSQVCSNCHCAAAVTAGITGMPGEQLLRSSQAPQHKHQHMLHTQQSLQQRNSVPSLSRDSMHIRDRDVHSQQQQQQQQHVQPHAGEGGEVGGSPHKVSSGKGSSKFRKRGVVADVCWMLRIKTFQVCCLAAATDRSQTQSASQAHHPAHFCS